MEPIRIGHKWPDWYREWVEELTINMFLDILFIRIERMATRSITGTVRT